jgi:transcriptional regulator with XRE-family HTH domain
MAELKIRQDELAEMLGMSRSALSRRMTGRAPWTLPEMLKLLDLIGQPEETLDDFFGRAA